MILCRRWDVAAYPEVRCPSCARGLTHASGPSLSDQSRENGRTFGSTRHTFKVREDGRIVSVAAIIATGVNTDGRREILGLGLAPSEAAVFWLGFLRSLQARGLKGVKLVISDAHEGLKAAVARVFKATWQRCRVHFMPNALPYVPKAQHQMVAAAIRTVFAQDTQAAASKTWRRVADQLRPRIPKLAALTDDAEADVMAFMAFFAAHWPKLHSTNPIERLNKEVHRVQCPKACCYADLGFQDDPKIGAHGLFLGS